MLLGCYYRCPIVVEPGDRDYPRFYVLAQVAEYNEVADGIRVEMHDLLGSGQYYSELFEHFFHTIAIKERKNLGLQRNMLPLRYRKYMTEFEKTSSR